MKRKFQSKKRYIYAFIIATVLFLLGFLITYSVAYVEYQRVISLQDPISYEIFKDKIKHSLFNEDICSENSFIEISEDLRIQGSFISAMESNLGKNNKNVLFRKKFYTLIQLEHFEFVKTINKECNKNINTILFFYSNNEEQRDQSENIGRLLSVIFQQNQQNLVIYSFDTNLDSEIINLLKEKYEVSTQIKIIVNEDNSFTTLTNTNQIQPLLN